ncbi:hypothetical protein KDN32_15690 [Nocardioides sp. J2M5]|uniref:hypothetical protein n=1 Tax=Nocardioides palaemonis TaxID=2829810 RepID=UPI001BA6E5C4|nr:hypothetical protein [Nocardioides palaemonis]MBS2939183.1 hypothetical protein [Nocardioides palaemonis]
MSKPTGEELLRQGRLADARAELTREAAAAEDAGDAEGLARAALGLSGLWVHDHRTRLDRARVAGLRERALAGLDPASSLARRLRQRHHVEELYGTPDAAAVEALVDDARSTGDVVQLAEALHLAYFCLLGPQHLRRRLDLADELVAVSVTTGDPLHGLLGLADRALVLHELGDLAAGRALEELRLALEETPCAAVAYVREVIGVMRTVGAGRLREAEQEAARVHRLGVEVGDVDADTWYAAQVLGISWLRGDHERMLELSRTHVDSVEVAEPAQVAFDAALAAAAAGAGDAAAARAALARLRVGTAGPPTSTSWLAALFALSEVAWELDDAATAQRVLDALGDHPGLPVVVSRGVVSFGSTSRALGSAAAVLGDLDGAVALLDRALSDDLAHGTPVCRPHTAWRLAEVLDRRAGPGDADRAERLREEALEGGRAHGLDHRVRAWAAPVAHPLRLRRSGRTWDVRLGDRRASVPASVGMGYLAELVSRPGVEVAALDLVTGHAVHESRSAEVLDERAIRAYRARVAELEREVADADLAGDAAGSERAHRELDAVARELVSATGLLGGARTFADGQERARVSVHKAVRRALAALTLADAEIGTWLADRVRTGAFCCFDPRP